ncbi:MULTISPECIES: hypothetical protein [Lactobacillaceae]|uniref:hypothetical protein n=1 Tax=Lactobacillaceae TaxID=33958 RepID=UPI0014570020|nr:hypothetical protein [Lactobacillus sp. HBUAS51381]NLR10283.1 hypothetical protein [Lactobacillus sp. HBUAS51381]
MLYKAMGDARIWLELSLVFGLINDFIGLFRHRDIIIVWLWQYHDWRVWGLFLGILVVYWLLLVVFFYGLRKLKQIMGRNDPPVTKN